MDRFRWLLDEILHDCGLEYVPYEKISALARLCGPAEVAVLLEELDGLDDTDLKNEPDDVRDEYYRRRTALSQALAEVGAPAIQHLLQTLNSPNPQSRAFAARSLGSMRAKQAFQPIVDLLARDEDDCIKMALIDALGDLGDERAVDVLLAYLKDPEQPKRGWYIRSAANALGKIGTERVVQPLIEVLASHSNWFARLGAAEGLRRLTDPRARVALRTALSDPDSRVRGEAARALGVSGTAVAERRPP